MPYSLTRTNERWVSSNHSLTRWFKQKPILELLFGAGEPGFHFETYDPFSLYPRVNWLNYSEDFTNTAWGKADVTVVGNKLVESATTAQHFISATYTSTSISYTVHARLKADDRSWAWIHVRNSADASKYAWFDLINGAVGTVDSDLTAWIVPAPSGFYDCFIKINTAFAGFLRPRIGPATADGVTSYAGNGTSGILIERAQLEIGDFTSYQKVTDWYTEYLAAVGAPNIHLWADTSRTQPIWGVEQSIAAWDDISGNGHVATQGTPNSRPVLSARFNLFTGTATLATQNVTTLAANYVLRFEGTGSITLSGTATGTYNAGSHVIACTAGTLTATVTGTVNNADIRLEIFAQLNIPAYQWVGSSSYYDTAGFVHYLRFDGIDDSLGTSSTVDLTASNYITVWAGAAKYTEASVGMVLEISTNTNTNTGAAYVTGPSSVGAENFSFASKGDTVRGVSATPARAPSVKVVTGVGSIIEPYSGVSLDGGTPFTSTLSQGAGPYGNHPAFIGRRNNATIPYTGFITSLTLRGSVVATSDSLIGKMNNYVASKLGKTI